MYTKEDNNSEKVTIRINIKTHKMLKKLSYLTEKSVTQLMREGAYKMIDEYKKILTNSDIVA